MMVTKTSAAVQSVAEILDGFKQNAFLMVKHLLKEEWLEAMPVDGTIWFSWKEKNGQVCDGNIRKDSLNEEQLWISKYKIISCPSY